MSNLADHARRELELTNEQPDVIDWYVKVVESFSDFGHSGSSAAITTKVLNKLLQFQNLSPLTNDPNEWMHISEDIAGQPDLWQSRRNQEVFSEDGGKMYYYVGNQNVKYHSKEVYFNAD